MKNGENFYYVSLPTQFLSQSGKTYVSTTIKVKFFL